MLVFHAILVGSVLKYIVTIKEFQSLIRSQDEALIFFK